MIPKIPNASDTIETMLKEICFLAPARHGEGKGLRKEWESNLQYRFAVNLLLSR
jgi:hypothetical protein